MFEFFVKKMVRETIEYPIPDQYGQCNSRIQKVLKDQFWFYIREYFIEKN